ncbi:MULTISPECIES: SLC13 family permease [unclassified Corynebacterium]|uniref:SLC13 family permease n=1 Tax=unclassified Corynebacterium TaxID=2624378 RepID=UPI00264C6CDB|nr:C4-dicarboxylate ABC transporter [Corynebacterium sp.]
MTFPQTLSLVLLIVVLLLAVWKKVNIGTLSLGAAFVLVLVSGADTGEMYEAFPASLVVLIIGVSLMFSHLQLSGSIHWVIDGAFRVVGDRKALIPWVGFLLGGFLSTVGVFSTGPIAVLVPLVAFISVSYRGTYLINELGVILGAVALGMSPLNPTGATISRLASDAGVSYSEWGLWAVAVVVTAVALAVLQVVFAALGRKGKLLIEPQAAQVEEGKGPAQVKNKVYAVSSLVGLGIFVVCVVVFGLDVGLTSMAVAAVLQLVFRPSQDGMFDQVPWSAVLLIGGLLTYLGLLQSTGTIDAIQDALGGAAAGALLLLVLAYLTALLCNVESSALGVLSMTMPLVFGFFGDSPAIFWVVAAVAIPSGLMVMNPIHIAGTLVVGNAEVKRQNDVFRAFMVTALCMTAVVPGVLCILPLVVGL